MKIFIWPMVVFSLNAHACWKVQATITANKDKIEIHQKMDHDKTYSFSSGKHLFHVKVPSKFERPPQLKDAKNVYMVEMGVQEKNGITLSPISKGVIIVQEGQEASMTKGNNETKEVITFVVKLTHI